MLKAELYYLIKRDPNEARIPSWPHGFSYSLKNLQGILGFSDVVIGNVTLLPTGEERTHKTLLRERRETQDSCPEILVENGHGETKAHWGQKVSLCGLRWVLDQIGTKGMHSQPIAVLLLPLIQVNELPLPP